MRLYDRIQYTSGGRPHIDNDQEVTLEVLDGSVCFDVSNVFDYLAGLDEDSRDRIEVGDLPLIVPQFEEMWMEYQVPPGLPSDMAKWHYESGISRVGLLLQTVDLANDRTAMRYYQDNILDRMSEAGKVLSGDPRWMISERICWQHRGVVEFIPVTRFWLIDGDGSVIRNEQTGEIVNAMTPFLSHRDRMSDFLQYDFLMHVNRHTHLAPLMAISLANCSNVSITNAPFKGPRQQRRALERKGIKQADFKTLVIEPMKQVLKTEGGIETNGLKKALHICRGHFATYSEDKPLFGKYSGTFWKPAHVRGNADHGTVYKDYKVKPPRE